MAGYSTRTLLEKLGIKENYKIYLENTPHNILKEFDNIPNGCEIRAFLSGEMDLIIVFSKEKEALAKEFNKFATHTKPAGMLWICWPKGSSGVKTDLNENIVRDIGLKNGLVDVKVISVDDVWSGLKFVYRLKDRMEKEDSHE